MNLEELFFREYEPIRASSEEYEAFYKSSVWHDIRSALKTGLGETCAEWIQGKSETSDDFKKGYAFALLTLLTRIEVFGEAARENEEEQRKDLEDA